MYVCCCCCCCCITYMGMYFCNIVDWCMMIQTFSLAHEKLKEYNVRYGSMPEMQTKQVAYTHMHTHTHSHIMYNILHHIWMIFDICTLIKLCYDMH